MFEQRTFQAGGCKQEIILTGENSSSEPQKIERSLRGIHARGQGLLKLWTAQADATWSQAAQSLFSQALPLKPAQQSQRILTRTEKSNR
jgi:hypothetical protein